MAQSPKMIVRIAAAASFGAFPMIVVARPSIAQSAASSADVAAGQALYQSRCAGCHSVDADRIGPRHRDVVGRAVASVPTYSYSSALKKLGGTWTPARLDQWLSGTQKMAPGSKMYLQMDDPSQRGLIIAYLQSVSTSKK